MIRRIALLAVVSGLAAPALAEPKNEFSINMGKALTAVTLARAYVEVCDAQHPEGQADRRDIMAAWGYRVDLAGFDRLIAGARKALPDLDKQLTEHDPIVAAAAAENIRGGASVCETLNDTLAEEMYDIRAAVRHLMRNADDFGIEIAEVPAPPPPSGDVQVLPLAAFSVQAETIMGEVGSKAGGQAYRDLSKAREERLLEWLKARNVVVLHGRVTAEDELREWRGDQQSRFLADCTSFSEDPHEERMAASLGQDMVVVGQPRWIRDDRVGGVVGLRECSIFTLAETGRELASADDADGLMLRPPAFDEAFAGPNEGIALGAIDRVLYDAEFENLMDGFGNGYTRRREDIYVLLRDGTAYRHEWNFAFTDLDVALSRKREPDRWFTWTSTWGTVTLTRTGGPDAGETIDLSEARRLLPMPSGQTLDHTYYYLNVGMSGVRRDRDYVFARDGMLTHTRGGFVAGAFGTHYLTVVGIPDVSRSRYSFEDFTLLIDGPDGVERHFVAMFDGDDAGNPDELIIDGQVHWTRDEK
ncbi:hypothetical protein [Mesorhizobium sp. CAU 1732]|uniref:hypothetical protein n=1 Tax=Mesorhizobium sp. CAU 1732 TaxID=3140358 RepID=UPI003261B2D8